MYITVQEFIQDNPYTSMDIMTGKGVLRLPAPVAQALLTDRGKRSKLKANGPGDTVLASDLLEYNIIKIIPYRKQQNYVFLLTHTKAEMVQNNYRSQIQFEQLEFDLSDIPPQWLEKDK